MDRVSMGQPKYKNKKSRRGKLSLKKLAREVSSVKKQIKEEIEVKSYDGVTGTTPANWSGLISTGLCLPQQGDAYTMRIGDKITVTGMDLRYAVQPGVTNVNQAIRVIILVSRENTTSAVSDVLESSYLGTVHAPYAFFNRHKRQDFRILHDQTHEFDLNSGNMQQWIRKKIKVRFPIVFDAGAQTVQQNQLRYIVVSNVAASAPTIQFASRTYYTDQ